MSAFQATDGTRLHYVDWGQGAPLVLIHGWPLNLEMWDYQLAELPRHGVRCIAYDRRGFGKSEATWDGYDYDTLAQDLRDLLIHLDLRGVTLAGFSMGGGEVARYMGRFGGERVAKTALIGAVTPYLLQTPDNPNGVPQSVFDDILEQLARDRAGFLPGFIKQFYGVGLITSPVSEPMLDWAFAMAMAGSLRATIECARSWSSTDFRGDMAAFKTPTLIVHGDNDKNVPFEASGKESAKLVPASKLKVYSGAPHGLTYTHKDELNRDLVDFVLDRPVTGGA